MTQPELRELVRRAVQNHPSAFEPTVFRPNRAQGILEYKLGYLRSSSQGKRDPFCVPLAAQARLELLRKELSDEEDVVFWQDRLRRPEQLVGNMLGQIQSGKAGGDSLVRNLEGMSSEIDQLLRRGIEDYAGKHGLLLRTHAFMLIPFEVTLVTDPPVRKIECAIGLEYELAKLQSPDKEPEWRLVQAAPAQERMLGVYYFRLDGVKVIGPVDIVEAKAYRLE